MATTQFPGASTHSPKSSRVSNPADVVVGQARAIEADSPFAQAPGMSVAMFIAAGLLFAVGLIAAGWAVFRVLAHA